MTTATTNKGKGKGKGKGRSVEAGLSATEAHLLEEVTAPVQSQEETFKANLKASILDNWRGILRSEFQDAALGAEQIEAMAERAYNATAKGIEDARVIEWIREDLAKASAENVQKTQEAPVEQPAAPSSQDDATEGETEESEESPEDRKAEALKKADKVLREIGKAAEKQGRAESAAWLAIGWQCVDYANLSIQGGSKYATALDNIQAKIGNYIGSYKPDMLIRAACLWHEVCEERGKTCPDYLTDKGRETVAKSIPWGHWINALYQLVEPKVKDASLYDGTYYFTILRYAREDVLRKMADLIEGKPHSRDELLLNVAEIARQNGENKAATIDQQKRDKAKEEADAREKALADRKAKEEADRREKEARDEKERAAREEARLNEEAKSAKDEAERERIEKQKEEAARLAKEKEEEEKKAKAEREEAEKRERERLKEAQEAQKQKEALERQHKTTTNENANLEETIDKRRARLNGEKGGSSKGGKGSSGTGGKDDKSPNLIDFAKSAAPKDLASAMFTMMRHHQMPFQVLKELIALLNDSKEGGVVFKADQTAQEVITAMVIALENVGK